MNEGFKDFFKRNHRSSEVHIERKGGGALYNKKETKKRWPKNADPNEVHDHHTDASFHHLYSLHKLTHPDSHWHGALKRLGGDSAKINEMHKDISALIDKYGK